MNKEGGENLLVQQVEAISHRTEKLYRIATEISQRPPQLVLDCLEELQTAIEELQVAEEELHHQSEELMLARQAIEAERQRYQNLFEFAPDGYLVTDIYGNIREANRAAASLMNMAQHHLVGKPLAVFVTEEQRRSFRAVVQQLPQINRVQEWEIQFRGRRNRSFDAAITVETVQDATGQASALRWLLRDITARKQAEKQLRQMQLQNLHLIEADRLKSQFMAALSHELRTPMNAILGFSHLLLRQFQHQQDPQLIHMVERILGNGKRLLTMIEEILDFSKLKAHRLELELESFDLAELATTTAEELRSLAEQKGLNLQVNLAQPSFLVCNDRLRVQQIITNLLSNAIKFTNVGSVRLEVYSLPDNRVAIAVHDTGIGIDPADQTRIFQEFWQVNQTRTRSQGGTGLGLSITHALVQLMQGTISVESQLGQGTTFRVELPSQVPFTSP